MCGFNNKGFFISSKRDDDDAEVRGLVQFAAGVRIDTEEIARGVAASSAFPPIFSPLPVTKGDPTTLHLLTDGGVYDNSGVKHLWEQYEENNWTEQRDRLVIVSDAGRAFSVSLGQRFDSIIDLAMRVSDTQGNRIAKFDSDRTQEFFNRHNIPVLRCSIHETIGSKWIPSEHSEHSALVQRRLGTIRTELDKFSDVEVFSLYRHGYRVFVKCWVWKISGGDLVSLLL